MVDRRDHLTPGYSIDQMADELYLALHQLKISHKNVKKKLKIFSGAAELGKL